MKLEPIGPLGSPGQNVFISQFIRDFSLVSLDFLFRAIHNWMGFGVVFTKTFVSLHLVIFTNHLISQVSLTATSLLLFLF